MVEGFCSLAITSQLHQGLSLDKQYLGIANLDAVNRILGNLKVLAVLIALIHALTIDGGIDGRIIMIGLAILRVLNLDEIGLGQTLVIRLFCLPVIIEVIIGHLSVVLGIAITILTILEGEGPRAVSLVVTLSIHLVTVVSNGEEVLISASFVALVLTTPQLIILWIEFQQTTGNHLVGIVHSLFQTAVGL